MKKLYGVITAMTTPFTADNKVDIAALEQTVKRFRVIPPKINSGQARFRRESTQTM